MPIDAVWIVVTIPQKEFEKTLIAYNRKGEFFEYEKNDFDSFNFKTLDNNFISLETILSEALDYLNINDSVWMSTQNNNYYHVYFPCEMDNNDHTMQYLKGKGIGARNNSAIGYIPFGLFYYNEKPDPNDPYNYNKNYFNEIKENFLKSVTSRLTVAQVVEGVKSGAAITFDFYMYLLCSSVIAAIAIMNNSTVDVAASMMIEPLMGSVMAIAFGMALWDKDVFLSGIKSLFIGLVFCLVFGYLFGLLFQIWRVAWNPPPDGVWPTSEMQSRGEYKTLIYGAVVATAGGAVLAVILLKNNICALTGVAVATTFMPPFVNAGLCFALATHLQISSNGEQLRQYNFSGEIRWLKPAYAPPTNYDTQYVYDMRVECCILAVISMAYTFVNVFCLGVSGFVVLKIKEIVPLQKISASEHKFFNEDIKIYRAHRKKYWSNNQGKPKDIGQTILEEWADISGINKKDLLRNSPEAKATQLQTLYDIAQDVEADENYQTITRHAFGTKHQPHLRRRLTQPSLHHASMFLNPINLPNNLFTINSRNSFAERNNSRVDLDQVANNGREMSGQYSNIGSRHNSLRYSVNSPYSVWPMSRPVIRNRSASTISGNPGLKHHDNTSQL